MSDDGLWFWDMGDMMGFNVLMVILMVMMILVMMMVLVVMVVFSGVSCFCSCGIGLRRLFLRVRVAELLERVIALIDDGRCFFGRMGLVDGVIGFDGGCFLNMMLFDGWCFWKVMDMSNSAWCFLVCGEGGWFYWPCIWRYKGF